MSSPVDEIAIKLGIQKGDLKAALLDSNADIKRFAVQGTAHVDGLTGAIKETHHAMRLFRQFIVAGGLIEAVKGFYEMAISYAEKHTEKEDENTEAVRRFGEATKETGSSFAAMSVQVLGFFNRIGEGFGSAVRSLYEFATGNKDAFEDAAKAEASEVALGRELLEIAKEKKLHGKEYEEITREIATTNNAIRDAAIKSLEPAARLVELERERAEVLERIESGTLDHIHLRRDELEVTKLQKEIQDAQFAIEKARADAAAKAFKDEYDARYAGLSIQARISEITQDIKLTETFISTERLRGHDVSVLQQGLDVQRLALAKAHNEEVKKHNETQIAIAGSAKEELELLNLQHRVVLGIATGPEEQRLRQIKLQRQERAVELEQLELAQKAMTEKLTPAETARLAVLQKQKDKLDEALAKLTEIMNLPAVPAPPVAATVAAVEKLNKDWDDFQVSVKGGADYKSMSDDMLLGIIGKQQDLLNSLSEKGGLIKNADQNYDYGGWLSAQLANQQIGGAQAQLAQRANIRSTVAAFGQSAAVMQFGDTAVSNALSSMSSDARNTTATLASIASTLNKVFPAQATSIPPVH